LLISLPLFSLVWAFSVVPACTVTVHTRKFNAIRIVISLQPKKEFVALPDFFAMFLAIVVDMIEG